MSKFTAEVIQFLLPHGNKRSQTTELDEALLEDYNHMRESGAMFHAEILQTGEVSITISHEEEDVDIEVVPNGPQVQEAMERMLRRRAWRRSWIPCWREEDDQPKRDLDRRGRKGTTMLRVFITKTGRPPVKYAVIQKWVSVLERWAKCECPYQSTPEASGYCNPVCPLLSMTTGEDAVITLHCGCEPVAWPRDEDCAEERP